MEIIEMVDKNHRARKSKEDKINPAIPLIEALNFVKPIMKKRGGLKETHVFITNGWLIAENELMTFATKIKEKFNACPQFSSFLDALKIIKSQFEITVLPDGNLSIASEEFKTLINCYSTYILENGGPDNGIFDIDEKLKQAIKTTAPLTDENGHYSAQNLLINESSVVAVNGHMIIEEIHNSTLKGNFFIPAKAAKILAKFEKPFSNFGYSDESVTFWYYDGSFIKIKTSQVDYPNHKDFFPNIELKLERLPISFFNGLDSINKFGQGLVYFNEGFISSSQDDNAATYSMIGLPSGMIFNVEYLKIAKSALKQVHFADDRLFGFSDNSRCVIMSVAKGEDKPVEKETDNKFNDEDDIPF